jgi:hypothetical protein
LNVRVNNLSDVKFTAFGTTNGILTGTAPITISSVSYMR